MTESNIDGDNSQAPPDDWVDERISDEEYRRESPRLRLRLHHFFALTAVMAVFLAMAGPRHDFGGQQFEMPAPIRTIQTVFVVLGQIPTAVAVTAVGYGIAAYRRGELFFNQPGHWLLVEIALVALLALSPALFFRAMRFGSNITPGDAAFYWMMAFGVYSLLVLVLGRILINIYLSRKCNQQRWKSVFYGKAVSVLFVGIGDVAVLVLLILAMRTDRRERLLRNAGHWCGVYVQLAQSSLMVLGTIVSVLGMILLWR